MNDTAAKPINYRQFYENVKTHVENLCTDRMRSHAAADVSHDLDVQVFRVLGGYDKALDERDALAARSAESELLREARESLKAIGDLYTGAQSGYIPGAKGWEEYERTHHPTEAMLSLQKTIERIDAFLGEKKEAEA
jgi:hypothetical protein